MNKDIQACNLNNHFKKFYLLPFFNSFTYNELYQDIDFLSKKIATLAPDKALAIKAKSPYLTFVFLMANLVNKQKVVILAHNEPDQIINNYKNKINFQHIFDDISIQEILKNRNYPTSIGKLPSIAQFTEQPFIIIFSSGSSHGPKAIALSFANLFFSSIGFSNYFNQKPEDVALLNLPHYHVSGLMVLWRAFFSGSSVVDSLDNKRIDFISLVPTQLSKYINDHKLLTKLKTFRVILIGGAPFSHELKNKAEKLKLSIYETYGMSETASLLTANGVLLPFREIVLNSNNLFMVGGKVLAKGTYENNNLIPFDQMLLTKDRGEKSKDNKFYFKERLDLIFISGGKKINPLDVEDVMRTHIDIKEAFLVSIKNEYWGEMGIMLYDSLSNNTLNIEILKKYLLNHLSPFMIPKFFFKFSSDEFNSIKISRSKLKELAYQKYLNHIFSFNYKENKDCPLVVFFHGFLGDKTDLLPISDQISKTHSILFIDLPGHGETKIQNFYSKNDIFLKITDFLKSFNAKKIILYGYSMGGRIALELSLKYLKIDQLILESTGLGLDTSEEKEIRYMNDLNLLNSTEHANLNDFLENWYSASFFYNYNQFPIYKNDITKKLNHDLNEWKKSLNYLSVGLFDTKNESLKSISQSQSIIHYIYGEFDYKCRNFALSITNQANQFSIFIKNVPESGHNPHKTHDRVLAQYLLEILK